jgi:hypothetical protein
VTIKRIYKEKNQLNAIKKERVFVSIIYIIAATIGKIQQQVKRATRTKKERESYIVKTKS